MGAVIKRLLLVLAFALLLPTSPAWATMSRTQHVVKVPCSTSCAVTISANSTGTTVLLIAGCLGSSTSITCSAVSGGGTWVHPASCRATTTTAGGMTDFWYLIAPASAVTTVTVTFSGGTGNAVWFEEIHTTVAPWTFGACGTPLSNQTAATAQKTPSINPNGTKNFMAGIVFTAGSIAAGSTVSGTGWTTPLVDAPGGDGADDGLDYGGGTTQATLTSTSGAYCSSDLWFTDGSGGAATVNCTLSLMGAGPC